MPRKLEPDAAELKSWKAISAFLRVSVRTAQRWQTQYGLPVRRNGRDVLASPSDLIHWKVSRGTPSPGTPESGLRFRPTAGRALLFALIAVLAVAQAPLRTRSKLVSFRVERGAIAGLDSSGAELWRAAVSPQFKPDAHGSSAKQRSWIGDIDGDERDELLIATFSGGPGPAASALECFSDSGARKWRFVPGRSVSTATENYQPPYTIESFQVVSTGRKPRQIVVNSRHSEAFPSQLALLSSAGALERQYWHPGPIEYFEVGDLDGDGHPELWFSGVNQIHRQATIGSLDLDRFGGYATEAKSGFALREFAPSRELVRALFPKACFNRLRDVCNTASHFWFDNGGITIRVDEGPASGEPSIYYHFSKGMRLTDVSPSAWLQAYHARLVADGTLDHRYSAEEGRQFRNIRFLTP